MLDCSESNDEVIARDKGYELITRHQMVCPDLIPLSPLALRRYEEETKELLKEKLSQIDYVNTKMGL